MMRNLTFVFASVLVAAGATIAGCSDTAEPLPNTGSSSGSSNTSGGGGNNNTSGGDNGNTSGGGGNNNTSGGDNGNTSGGGGDNNTSGGGGNNTSSGGTSSGGCPARLRPDAEKGVYCAYIPSSSGGSKNCTTAQTCCNGNKIAGGSGYHPSSCVDGDAEACGANTTAYECTEKNDCNDGQVCCIVPEEGKQLAEGAHTRNQCAIVQDEGGTRCKATCGAGEWQACQADTDCDGGKTCKLLSLMASSLHSGVCQ